VRGFETARLRMRPLDARDKELYCDLYTDEETMHFICAPLSRATALRIFRNTVALPRPLNGPFLFAMEQKETGEAIGICAVVQVDPDHRRAEIGMMLRAQARAAGCATEVLRELANRAFACFPIDCVWVQYAPAHIAAERLVVKLGFEPWRGAKVDESRTTNCIWAASRSRMSCNVTNEGNDDVECRELS